MTSGHACAVAGPMVAPPHPRPGPAGPLAWQRRLPWPFCAVRRGYPAGRGRGRARRRRRRRPFGVGGETARRYVGAGVKGRRGRGRLFPRQGGPKGSEWTTWRERSHVAIQLVIQSAANRVMGLIPGRGGGAVRARGRPRLRLEYTAGAPPGQDPDPARFAVGGRRADKGRDEVRPSSLALQGQLPAAYDFDFEEGGGRRMRRGAVASGPASLRQSPEPAAASPLWRESRRGGHSGAVPPSAETKWCGV